MDTDGRFNEIFKLMGVTPECFQSFAADNRAAGSPFFAQVTRFEAAIVSVSKNSVKFKSEFITALAEVLAAFATWKQEENHA